MTWVGAGPKEKRGGVQGKNVISAFEPNQGYRPFEIEKNYLSFSWIANDHSQFLNLVVNDTFDWPIII